jgi:hypothetical protein
MEGTVPVDKRKGENQCGQMREKIEQVKYRAL